ncbi:hypothetical protein SDC9_188752 [bioreactor metagenome]|uniref:Uncharacterized protein n=1 Tax=bioreactor metagenome TaxID=1076179 RepID=A0A645HQS8_9ZZZZ
MGVQPQIGVLFYSAVDALALFANDKLLRADRALHLLALGPGKAGQRHGIPALKHQRARRYLGRHNVGAPNKGCHKHIFRPLVNIFWGTHMLDHAVFHHRNGVADGHGFLLVMRDIHRRDADTFLGVADDAAHFQPQLGVKV